MRTLSNCLTSNNTILTFEEEDFSQLAKELIEIFEIFNDWKKMDIMSVNLAMLIESNDEIQHFFATLQNESTLALFLIYTDAELLTNQIDAEMPFHELESFKQIKYLMVLLKDNNVDNYDIHVLTKAIGVLYKFHCRTWKQSKLLYFSDLLGCLSKIMSYQEMSTSREAALLSLEVIKKPDDLCLWLKFASDRLPLNSACTEDLLITIGEPFRLPTGRGLYRDWGAFFDFGDCIEIPGGLSIPGMIMEKWTVSFWMILPLNLHKTNKRHVLVQNIKGTGAYIEVNESCSQIQTICEETGRIVTGGFDLRK